jgi:hypothetical protein
MASKVRGLFFIEDFSKHDTLARMVGKHVFLDEEKKYRNFMEQAKLVNDNYSLPPATIIICQ